MSKYLLYIILRITPLWFVAGFAFATDDPLTMSLDSYKVDINIDFTGTELLLFGSIDEKGDVVIVLEGPKINTNVWRKERKFGVWVNDVKQEFYDVPSYYYLATTKEKGVIPLSGPQRKYLHIGYNNINYSTHDLITARPFKKAMLEYFIDNNLYKEDYNKIRYIDKKLFRINLPFSVNAPVGTYIVHTYYIEDGAIVSAQSTPILLNKRGIGEQIFSFSRQYSAIYGIICVLLAVILGYLANYMFRRR